MKNDILKERKLSPCEITAMRVIWSAHKDISVSEYMEILAKKFRTNYSRTTMLAFLVKLTEKGFIKIYHEGEVSYIHECKSVEEYRKRVLSEQKYWPNERIRDLICTSGSGKRKPKRNTANLKELIDSLED